MMGTRLASATASKLSTKAVGALTGFLALAVVVIGITLFLSWQLEGSAAAINDTGSLRMHGYQLALQLSRQRSDPGQTELTDIVAREIKTIDTTLSDLHQGNPQRPLLLPSADPIRRAFDQIFVRWHHIMRPIAIAAVTGIDALPLADWRNFQQQTDLFVTEVQVLVQRIERDSEQRMFWLRSSQLVLLALAFAGTVSLIYLMFIFIIGPVTLLQEGIGRMKEMDFSVRLVGEGSDEFGQLAQGFNQMADRLQALYGNLGTLVATKTAALEDQNRELALLYDCSAFLQRPQPLEALCEGFLQRISSYFSADGGSVRSLDAARDNLHMVAHHGISETLLEAERCLKVGDCLCGAAIAQKITVVHDLRQMDRAHQMQCHREGFVTVSIFHIHAFAQHLGFFNLHFRTAKTFSKREEALLETLGQLLGIAIENLRLAAREREMAISEERNLVAQGLHDSIAQGLNYLNLQVQMLDDSLQDGRYAEVTDIVPALRAGVQESYEDVRELLHNYRSRLVEGDLLDSIESTLEKFRRQTGIAAVLVADVDGAPFGREQQLQVLFIVQEALSNVRKHAVASRVEVELKDVQDFVLTIMDNGVGFDSAMLERAGEDHVGIHIMRERAERLAATLDVTTAPGAGTTVTLQLLRDQRRAA